MQDEKKDGLVSSAAVSAAVMGASRPRFCEITIRDRGRLPHWEMQAGLYFVTFRLEDSLPAHVRRQMLERKRRLEAARRSGRKLAREEMAAIKRLNSKRVEELLDAGAGKCYMKDPRVARIVAEAIQSFEAVRYQLYAWCVMPNHAHVVFRTLGVYSLAFVVGGWKSYTSKAANRLLQREGHFWEREYYDRLVRDDAELARAIEYVMDNPSRAGLKDWPWVWCAGGDASRDCRRDAGATS